MGIVELSAAARVAIWADGWISVVLRLLIEGHFKNDCREKARALTFEGVRDVAVGSGCAIPSRRARASGSSSGAASRFRGPTVINPCFCRATA